MNNTVEELAKIGLTFYEEGIYSYTPADGVEEERKQIQKDDPPAYKKWKNAQYNRNRELKEGLNITLNNSDIPSCFKDLLRQCIVSNDIPYHRKLADQNTQLKKENKKLSEIKESRRDYEMAMFGDEWKKQIRADVVKHYEDTLSQLKETIAVLRKEDNGRYSELGELRARPSREALDNLKEQLQDQIHGNETLREEIKELKQRNHTKSPHAQHQGTAIDPQMMAQMFAFYQQQQIATK